MTLKTLPQTYSICKVEAIPSTFLDDPYVFIGVTPEEKSVVCPTEKVPETTLARDDNWKGFFIEGTLDFSLIGVLAKISAVLAQEKIGIYAVSTYNTDYIFVKSRNFSPAIEALRKNGMTVKE